MLLSVFQLLLVLQAVAPSSSFSSRLFLPVSRKATPRVAAAASDSFSSATADPSELKQNLLEIIKVLRDLQEEDGDFDDIDWGVKGGELNKTEASKNVAVPAQMDFYSISEKVGKAADKVMEICDSLAKVNPTKEPTKYLGDKQNGDQAPLNGRWRLLFSNAADASFSSKGKRGKASPQNVVNAKKGRITNVINFDTLPDGTEPTLKQLNVQLKAKAVSANRVRLWFLYVKPVVTKFFGIPLLGAKLPLYFFIRPISWIVYTIDILRQLTQRLLRKEVESKILQVYFDVLYLDDDLRVHKTGQDNIFVQAKESWETAQPLLQ